MSAYETFRNANGVGQQTKAASIPIVLASDSDPLQITQATGQEWSFANTLALAASKVVKGAAGTLRSASIRLDSTAPSATYYVQLHNAAALPADNAVPYATVAKVIHTQGVDDLIVVDCNELGVAFSTGIVFCLSSTEATKTLAGAYLAFQGVEYR